MLSNRDKARELCIATHHEWVEEYYGYKCEQCGDFVPYGCEPWAPDDDWLETIPFEPVNYQSRVAEQRDGAVLSDTHEACPADRHVYYAWFLTYQYCPYCGERLHV